LPDRSKKGKSKYQKDRHVEQFRNYYDLILRLFLKNNDKSLYKNQIYDELINIKRKKQQTGLANNDNYLDFQANQIRAISSKEYCYGALDMLFRNGFIENFKIGNDNKEDKRKIIFKLSDLGETIAKFLKEMYDYQYIYYELEKAIEKKIPYGHIHGKLIFKYHELGWKEKEVGFYYTFRSNVLDFKNLMDNNFMNIVMLRYSKIRDDPFFYSNEKARIILNEMIIRVFENKIFYALEKYKMYQESANVRWIENYNPICQIPPYEERYESGLEGTLPFYKDIENFFNCKIVLSLMYSEIKDMALSYLKLLEFPKDKIPQYDINSHIENKTKLIEDNIFKNKYRHIDGENKYNYKNLESIRFGTWELFHEILKQYIK
jgi:hypothetical protein